MGVSSQLYHLHQHYPTLDDALRHIIEVSAVLEECATYFDNRSDVKDGPDGQPEANEEMALLAKIEAVQ